MQILTNINLEKNELLNAIIHRVTSDPTVNSKNQGMLIYNTTDKKLKYYNGTEWIVIGASSGGGSISIDTTITDTSTNDNAAGSKAVVDYVKSSISTYSAVINQINSVSNNSVLKVNSSGAVSGISVDTTVTKNSTKLITSGAVYNAINDVIALNRVIETNPKLTSSSGKATWTISLDHNNKALVQIYEVSTNEVIFASIKDTASSIEITFNGVDGNISAGTYSAVIIY
jgi:hypothetical protein